MKKLFVIAILTASLAACGGKRSSATTLGADRPVSVARELTKLYEEVWRGSLREAMAWADEKPPRGEVVLVVGGAPAPDAATDDDVRAALRVRLDDGMSKRDASASVAGDLGLAKRHVYDLATKL
jgi:16S rRNA (cytidine1402-2'-O)-methyltransferase